MPARSGIGAAQCNLETEPYVAMTAVREAEMLVDAVYGIGFHGRSPDALRPVFRLANQSDAPVIALDVPSGFSADSGVYDEDTIRAEYTVTFTAMKPGLLVHGASELTGPVEVAQIGIDPALLGPVCPEPDPSWTGKWSACFLPPAPLDSHKGTYGRVLAVCGSVGMAGRPCWPSGLRSAVAPAWLRRRCRVRCIRPWRGKTSRRSTVCSRKHRTGWSRRRRAICLREELGRASAVLVRMRPRPGGIRSRRWWRICSRRPLARWYWTRMV